VAITSTAEAAEIAEKKGERFSILGRRHLTAELAEIAENS
jgi:hypothetical protein